MADLKLFLDSCICKRLCLCHCASVFTVRGRRCSCVRRMWVWTACCLCRSFKACQNSTQVEGQGGYTEGGSVSGVWCWWVLVQWSGCLSTNDSSACFHTQSRQLLWNININEAHGRKHTSHTFFFVSFFFFSNENFFQLFCSRLLASLFDIHQIEPFFFFFFFFFSPRLQSGGVKGKYWRNNVWRGWTGNSIPKSLPASFNSFTQQLHSRNKKAWNPSKNGSN